MSIRTTPWPAGTPCWADLNVPDIDDVMPFYASVLGWSFGPPNDDFDGYTIADVGSHAVAGIGRTPHGSRPVWTLYFASDDADATAAAIEPLGGRLLLPPSELGELGRLLIALDPTGAAFGVWEAGTHIGASLVNQAGGITWEDLRSPEPDVARDFYAALFGFTYEQVPGGPSHYSTFAFAHDPRPIGGIGGMFGDPHVPAHWLVYFAVDDVPTTLTAAVQHGGSVVLDLFDTPFGQMAGLADPAGAMFWVAQTRTANDPT